MKTKLEDRPTKTQRRLLIQHMKETRHIEGKGKDRKYQWQKITMELNAIGPPKDVAQWKKQWQNMRLATRKKLQEISRRHPGSPIPELNEEDNEIMEIEASHSDTYNSISVAPEIPIMTNFKQENLANYNNYNVDYIHQPQLHQQQARPPEQSQASSSTQFTHSAAEIPSSDVIEQTSEVKIRRKYKKRVKKEGGNEDSSNSQNYIQPKTKLSMEVKSRTYKGMCEIAKHGKKKKKHMDSDELFLMSFVGELKKIPEYKKLEVKGDIIAIFKKWTTKTQETQVTPENLTECKLVQNNPPTLINKLPQTIENHINHQSEINEINENNQPPPILEDSRSEKIFELEKQFISRPLSQLSQNSNSLGAPSSPLNLQQTSQSQTTISVPHQPQTNLNHFNLQHNPALLHSVQQLIPLSQQQNLQHLQHHQQQHQIINQHHNITTLPTQHFPIYPRYGNL